VDIHLEAARTAALTGDAKPAQWALEHIQDGEQRVVEREKAGTGQPSISIGIAVGGIPQPRALTSPVQTSELPILVATPMADTP
jgi:hypothetical protein